MDKQQFGSFIAGNRKAAGLTQKDLAGRLHVTDKAVSKWERALSYPDVTLLEPLAEALEMGVEELMACRRLEVKKEEEQPVQTLLEISRENLKREQRKNLWQIAGAALVVLAISLAAGWHQSTYVSEEREDAIVLKETVEGENYIYVEEKGHLIRLKCGGGVDFEAIALTDEWGEERVFVMDCRWNRRTYQGTVTSCYDSDRTILGTAMDVTYETDEMPLFGYPVVYFQNESRYPDPYAEPRGHGYLSDYRFWIGTWDPETCEWLEKKTILTVKDCFGTTVTDIDQDGENELVVWTRWPEKPYQIYDEQDGEIISCWPDSVPPEVEEELRSWAFWLS